MNDLTKAIIYFLLFANFVLLILITINFNSSESSIIAQFENFMVEDMTVSKAHTETIHNQKEGLKDSLGCISTEPEFVINPDYSIREGTIFVSVASYRDDECSTTIRDLFEKAANPDRVFVGAVEQNKPGEEKESCVYNCPGCKERLAKGQIRIQHFKDSEARGPSFARWAATKLWEGEEYFMQIDSHMHMEQNWDEDLITQMKELGDPKGILSSYPPTKDQMDMFKKQNFSQTVANCSGGFNDGMFQSGAAIVPSLKNGKYRRIPFIAAGFLFAPFTLLYDVPFDPYSSAFVFFCEEALMSMFYFCAGYNIYAPRKHVLDHNYGRPTKPKFFSNQIWGQCKDRAHTRAKYQMGLGKLEDVHEDFRKDIDKYYVNRERTPQEFLEFIQFDAKEKKVKANFCG